MPVQSQVLLLLIACGLAVAPARSQSIASPEVASHRSPDAALPVNFIRRTGDLDSMVKRGNIRALVLYSRSGFFYVNGKPEGIYYEALQYFEKFVNQKLRTRQHVQVTFIPVRPDQIQAALIQGVGDLIAYGVAETSERGHQIAFSIPIQTGVKQIVVTQKNSGALLSLEDLGGKQVFVNPLSTYYGNLEKVNNTLRERGKSPILIRKADPNLMDEDLLEMVNAGILSATVTLSERAELWASVLPNIISQPNLVVANGEDLAWAMRKSNPRLKELVDEFVRTRAVGTSFGNTLVRRYLGSNQWVMNPTTAAELRKFEATVDFFRKYSSQYGFDYLMVMAQGYQESMLEQSARGPAGAVGIMQVKPSTSAAPPISIPDIWTAEKNIHAGVKVLGTIADTYFNDPKIDPESRLLFAFAAYNARPDSHRGAAEESSGARTGSENKWFENVELLVSRSVGPETVQYVSNIFKYYVAYKLVIEQGKSLRVSGQNV